MRSLRFSLLGLLGIVFFVGLACAALIGTVRAPGNSPAPYWWSSAIVTLTALFLGMCLLAAAFSRGRARCAFTGAAMMGGLYWLLVFSTWFGGSIGNRLLTTRAIAWAEQKAYASQQPGQPPQVITTTIYSSVSGVPTTAAGGPWDYNQSEGWFGGMPGGMGLGAISPSGMSLQPVYTTSGPVYVPTPVTSTELAGPPTTAFQEICHYVLIWPLAMIGALLASVIYVRSRRGEATLATASPAPPGDNTDPAATLRSRTSSASNAPH